MGLTRSSTVSSWKKTRRSIDEEFDATKIKRGPILTLVIVQAKQTPSFAETPFEKLSATLREVLALSNSEERLQELFSADLVERLEIFRRTWHKLSTRHPNIRIEIFYTSKGNTAQINDKVVARSERLVEQIREDIPKADAGVSFLGSRELLDLAGRDKSYTLQLPFRALRG